MRSSVALIWVLAMGASGFVAASTARAECDSSQTSKPSSSRLVVKGGAVYDKKTDLTWMRCSQGQTWKDDLGCVGVPKKFTHDEANQGWSNGWRVPTVDELKTIIAKNCKNPAIDDEIFPDTPSEWYHTSSKTDSYCWHVNFGDGHVANDSSYLDSFNSGYYCGNAFAVRLVRSGQ